MSWTLSVPAVDPSLTLEEDADQIALPMAGPLTPAMTDSFYGGAGFLRFTRNTAGRGRGVQPELQWTIDFRLNKQQ